jgi:Family of unknown function (DUF6281)
MGTRKATVVVALLLALALAGCGSGNDRVRGEPNASVEAEGSCVLTVLYDGHRYDAIAIEVAPPEGEILGQGTLPPCNDTGGDNESSEQIEITALEGVAPSFALLWAGRNDVVFVRDDVDSGALPHEISRLLRASECDSADEPIELAGPWLGILGADGDTEVDLVPPYDLEMFVENASSPRYERANVSVRVPAALGEPLSREDVRSSLWKGGTISLTVTCREGLYIAQQVDAYPPA